MLTFDMKVKQNFAAFIDPKTGISVFVDSFDNKEFDVRIGTVLESRPIGIVIAEDDYTLNFKIKQLVESESH